MSDLAAAMQAAVNSVDARPRVTPSRATSGRARVVVLEDHDLPPVRRGARATSFSETLGSVVGLGARVAWTLVREGFALVGLFWAVAVLFAFVVPVQATLVTVLAASVAVRIASSLVTGIPYPGRLPHD